MMSNENLTMQRRRHHSIPPIYLSYLNENNFLERYFVVKLYERLVKNGLGESVLWFDHQQGIHSDRSATWFADRLEAIDLSLGSLLILSNACQCQRLMLIESKAISNRKILSKTSSSYALFVILLDQCQSFTYLSREADYFYEYQTKTTISNADEQISIILDDLLRKLVPYKSFCFMRNTLTNHETQFKPLCTWSPEDIQLFLRRFGVQQSSRDLFLEKEIDGYLFLACTENDLKEYFLINNYQTRYELIEHVIRSFIFISCCERNEVFLCFLLETIHDERESSLQWHCAARRIQGISDHVYIIHHSEDSTIANKISNFLREKNFQIFTHQLRYGKTKDQFLALNGPILARAKYVIFILTKKSSCSIFPFLELTIATWFEKSIITICVENVWNNMRSTLRALLQDYPMVDFIHQSLQDGLATLSTHLPSQIDLFACTQRSKQAVESFRNKKNFNWNIAPLSSENKTRTSRFVYLSYSKMNEKWSVIHTIERLIMALETNHFYTGIQVKSYNNTSKEHENHYLPKIPLKSSSTNINSSYLNDFNQSSINIHHSVSSRDIRDCSVMIICLTPKYFYNELCLNELRICEIYQKPIIICLLRHINSYHTKTTLKSSGNYDEQLNMFIPARLSMPTIQFLRKNIRTSCIDLSTDDLFSRNFRILLQKLHTMLSKYENQIDTSTDILTANIFDQTSEIF
ncbi:hypothetical protein I4U23_010115 [Adineta vaga]|nr:hypothetical protein I4U23_010115 [Adineta vaga]